MARAWLGETTISDQPESLDESEPGAAKAEAGAAEPNPALKWENPIYDNNLWTDTPEPDADHGDNIPPLERFVLSLLFRTSELDTREGTLLAELYPPKPAVGGQAAKPAPVAVVPSELKPEPEPATPSPPIPEPPPLWTRPERQAAPEQPLLVETRGKKRDAAAELFYRAEPDIVSAPPSLWTGKRLALAVTVIGLVVFLVALLRPA